VAERAHALHLTLGDAQAIAHPGIHHVFRMGALIELGRLAEAEDLGTQGHAAAAQGGPPIGRIWWTLGLGRVALLEGRPRTALQWLGESAAVAQGGGFDGPRRRVLSYLAVAQALLGDATGARATVDEIDSLPPYAFMMGEQELGRAWCHLAEGEPERAREVLRAAVGAAAASGHHASEAWLLHDLARLGEAESAAERLAAVDRLCEGDLVPCFARHAEGLAHQDGDVLAAAATAFVTLGCTLFAAEAATAAAHAYERGGEPRKGAGQRGRAAELAARCEDARTPGLVSATVTVPLSSREREVALLAAEGLPSKEIADRLYLSRRTIDNHLQRIYLKLGIGGRSELAEVLELGDR
jgi:ATP/maltotriose-dependent transcriptional regulator MalT